VPKTGVVAGVYVQAISAYAPHPNAAKLWMEYIYSDEGQLGWLEGYCHPIRFNDLAEERQDPAGPARQAAAGRGLRGRRVPDPRGAGRLEGTGWDSVVGKVQ
jgi:putative spermidine/putrescine transport system substrate-binding protein